MSDIKDRPEAYAACDKHLPAALRTLLPDVADSGLYRVSRYDGTSDQHMCACGEPATFFFLRLQRVTQQALDKAGVRVTRG